MIQANFRLFEDRVQLGLAGVPVNSRMSLFQSGAQDAEIRLQLRRLNSLRNQKDRPAEKQKPGSHIREYIYS